MNFTCVFFLSLRVSMVVMMSGEGGDVPVEVIALLSATLKVFRVWCWCQGCWYKESVYR